MANLRLWLVAALFVVPVMQPSQALADYPERTVELIVPWAAGGVTDLTARALSEFLSKKWGRPVQVINRVGGAGVPGVVSVMNAKPDGYTILMASIQTGSLNPAGQKNLPYKWDQPTFIARTNVTPIVLLVGANSQHRNVQDLISAAKAEPAALKYSTSGPTGTATLALAQMFGAAGIDPRRPVQVVYSGGNPVVVAVAGGHVDVTAGNLPEVLEMNAAGKIRPLAVTTPERLKSLPNVPTAKEAGIPQFKLMGWGGIMGPPALPKDIVEAWNKAVRDVLADPAFQQKLEKLGSIPGYLAADDFRVFVKEEYEETKATLQRLGL